MDSTEFKEDVERCLAMAEPEPDIKQLYERLTEMSYNLAVAKSDVRYYQQRCINAEHDLKLLKRRVHKLSADI